jgi:hypothetical protein
MDPHSSTASDPAGPAAPAVRRRRRDRNELPVRYLLDSRLFRLLCAPGQPTAALDGFRASLARHRLPPEGGLPALELTPLAFLEVIGVEHPQYEAFSLPQKAIRTGKSALITGVVVRMTKEFFEKAPELQASNLRKRVEELREKTDPAAHELFDSCLTRFVSREGFAEEIQNHLAFDSVYRYRFPDSVREPVLDFLAAGLVAVGESVSGLSKMRAVKMIWDRSYERLLKKHPGARGELQALDREMRLRTFQDYLDWEVVHHSIMGFAAENRFHPVTAFTVDSAATLTARCVAYKSALRAFLDQIDREELVTTLRPKLTAWRPGLLVPCQEDGTFDTLIPTGELPVF